MSRSLTLFSTCLLCGVFVETVAGQESAADTAAQAMFVFLDCNAPNCDFDHFRREITWINWVRDRQDADLHLLITAQRTGGGGWQYTLDYLGRRSFDGTAKSKVFVTDPDDTDAEVRDELARSIAVGLVQFVEATPLEPRLRVVYEAPELAVVEREENDPWNLWVFRIGGELSVSGESQERGYSIEGYARADRVSEDLKVNFRLSGEYDHEEFDEIEEGVTFVNNAGDYDADLLMVWSMGDHWSAGGRTHVNRSTFLNRDLAWFGGPALEYDVFPYSESTRRAITFLYEVELAYFDYELLTVEDQTEELLLRHSLLVSAAVQQPWGEIFGSVEGIQYLHDLATHRINTELDIEYRLFRGLDLEIYAEFSRIKDQFYLPAEDLTPAEILVRRRQRETDYRFDVGIGFSYRFGSKFANIVNPRMDRH
ncbi:MAG: hypothetical protein P8X82_05995 [Gemmatimonadales bacterium]|jgi:hypothetical protein